MKGKTLSLILKQLFYQSKTWLVKLGEVYCRFKIRPRLASIYLTIKLICSVYKYNISK